MKGTVAFQLSTSLDCPAHDQVRKKMPVVAKILTKAAFGLDELAWKLNGLYLFGLGEGDSIKARTLLATGVIRMSRYGSDSHSCMLG